MDVDLLVRAGGRPTRDRRRICAVARRDVDLNRRVAAAVEEGVGGWRVETEHRVFVVLSEMRRVGHVEGRHMQSVRDPGGQEGVLPIGKEAIAVIR